MMSSAWRIVLGLGVVLSLAGQASAEFALKDTDRVILFGDSSVTDTYAFDWVDQFIRSKYPTCKAEFIRMGKTRSTAADGLERLTVEVLPLKPTRVILCFGLDEGELKPLEQERLEKYAADMGRLIDALRDADVAVSAMTPPPSDQSSKRGLTAAKYDEVVAAHAERLIALCAEKEVPVLNWHRAVKDYVAAQKTAKAKLHWTKHGTEPTPLSVAVATDLLLTHWDAEPIDYLVTATWASNAPAQATMGTAKLVSQSDTQLVLALTDVPVALDRRMKGNPAPDYWPLAKWCSYRLKIEGLTGGGVIISESGRAAKPFLAQQLATGADMSAVGPLVDNETSKALYNATRTKLNQYGRYNSFVHEKAPEPELEEGYRHYIAAYKSLALGTHQILCRTPSRFDITLTIEVAAEAAKKQAVKKPAAKKQ